MANPFLNTNELMERDVETALLLEQANVLDIGKAVAYTDGDRIFVNTEDNLFSILPAYDHRMLKWLLWHEKMHLELRHHNRFFRYLKELDEEKTMDEFHVTKNEVNIIMDILVHDSMARMFPELVEVAIANLAQMRNRNSLGYTFKTNTLEEMLKEYADFKHKDPDEDDKDGDEPEDDTPGGTPVDDIDEPGVKKKAPKDDEEEPEEEKKEDGKGTDDKKGHEEGKSDDGGDDSKPEDGAPEVKPDEEEPLPDEHDKTDWSKLEDRDDKEFIEKDEGDHYMNKIAELKAKKFRLAKLTETLNGLSTTTRRRSYAMPSTISVGDGIMLKGSTPGRTKLHLCFDASGSMGRELATFKDIISKSIPQAMNTPTTWFSGYGEKIKPNPEGRSYDYYKGKFSDIMPVQADSGYSDDGDRTIELCWEAEQAGYCPIGVTDGGGNLGWSMEKLRQLKHTVLVGQNKDWLEEVQRINPKVQIIYI